MPFFVLFFQEGGLAANGSSVADNPRGKDLGETDFPTVGAKDPAEGGVISDATTKNTIGGGPCTNGGSRGASL